MFDMGIGDLMNNAAALKEEQDDKRVEAMSFACELIKDIISSQKIHSSRFVYHTVILNLLENDYYNALSDVDFDVIYRLISD